MIAAFNSRVQIICDSPEFMPVRATDGSAGYDVFAAETVVLHALADVQLVSTGVRLDMTGSGLYAELFLRSSMSKTGVILANAVGVIDQDYQGPVKMALRYIVAPGRDPYVINKGQKIAQLVFKPLVSVAFEPVAEFVPTVRGSGSFGSTDK